MLKYDVECLYNSISNDLKISKYEHEDDKLFHRRLAYSAISYWVLNIFRDKYEITDVQVSKSHVTITASDVLRAYLKIDESLCEYFDDVPAFVNVIEESYVNLGYALSGNYSFKLMENKQRVQLNGDESLLIRNYIHRPKVVGIGIIKKKKDSDITIDEFFTIKKDSNVYFNELLKHLKFDEFSSEFGKLETYNFEKRRWDSYSENAIKKYQYCVVRIDDGLEYAVSRIVNGNIQIAKLPLIYSKQEDSAFFRHEEWRIILGCASTNGYTPIVKVSDYYSGAKKYKFVGYILPDNEMSFIRCISWPVGHACYNGKNAVDGYIVPNEYCEIMDKILDRFNIKKESD